MGLLRRSPGLRFWPPPCHGGPWDEVGVFHEGWLGGCVVPPGVCVTRCWLMGWGGGVKGGRAGLWARVESLSHRSLVSSTAPMRPAPPQCQRCTQSSLVPPPPLGACASGVPKALPPWASCASGAQIRRNCCHTSAVCLCCLKWGMPPVP